MAKTQSRKKPAARRAGQARPAATQYSKDYPIAGGHNYLVKSIPRAIWTRANRRAKTDGPRGRSIRNVIIRALELYADRRFDAPLEEPTPAPADQDLATVPVGEIFGSDVRYPGSL